MSNQDLTDRLEWELDELEKRIKNKRAILTIWKSMDSPVITHLMDEYKIVPIDTEDNLIIFGEPHYSGADYESEIRDLQGEYVVKISSGGGRQLYFKVDIIYKKIESALLTVWNKYFDDKIRGFKIPILWVDPDQPLLNNLEKFLNFISCIRGIKHTNVEIEKAILDSLSKFEVLQEVLQRYYELEFCNIVKNKVL